MSPLTKTFVVVHVILSVMLTAGLVVFVNRVEDFKTSFTKEQAKSRQLQMTADASMADANAAKANAERALQGVNGQFDALKAQIATLNTQLQDRDVKAADSASNIAQLTATSNKLGEALRASEDQKAKLGEMITQQRATLDDLTKKNSEQSSAISSLTNQVEVTTRELKFANENNVQHQDLIKKLTAYIKDNQLPMPGDAMAVGIKAGAPPINGVVRGVKSIDGIPFATISVGSVDQVIKGMEFKVIDREKGEFLGVLTVDTVESNEATGRLEGPKVAQVKAGTEVRTQL